MDRSEVIAPDFDAAYRADPDPWGVSTTWYEQRKLSVLLACLPQPRYAQAWEPGCGPGITTAGLAGRVDMLLATEASAVAASLAAQRCADLPQVTVRCSTLPDVPLDAPVDLIVVAEFLYYVADLDEALDALWSAARPGSHLVFLHWAHRPHDAFRSGSEMHAAIGFDAAERSAARLVTHADADFNLDIFEAAR